VPLIEAAIDGRLTSQAEWDRHRAQRRRRGVGYRIRPRKGDPITKLPADG
jgi:hypothetical protein